jgi:hypothetical protein
LKPKPPAPTDTPEALALKKDVKKVLDYHFSKMGVNPYAGEFAAMQTDLVYFILNKALPPHMIEAEQRVQDELDERAEQSLLAQEAAQAEKDARAKSRQERKARLAKTKLPGPNPAPTTLNPAAQGE